MSQSDWRCFGAYAATAAANQALWLTFAPITTLTAHSYHVSDSAVGWLANIFPLVFVLLSVWAGRLLDTRFRTALTTGGTLTAAGAVVRVPGHSYTLLLLGQLLIAIGQPLILNAITAVSTRRLATGSRPRGIAFGSAAMFLGMVVALALGTITTASNLHNVLLIEAIWAVIAAAWLSAELARPERGDAMETEVSAGALRRVWRLEPVRRQAGLVFLGFGVFVALTTWLQTLVAHAGIGTTRASALLVAMVVAGAVGSAVLAPLALSHRRSEDFLRLSAVVTAIGCLILATGPGLALSAIAVTATGLVLLADLPLLLHAAEELSGADAATGTGLLWLAGNAGGVVVTLLVQGLLTRPWLAFAAMAAVICLALPLVRRPAKVAIAHV